MRAPRWVRVVATSMALLVALAGCASTRALPAGGVNAAELEAYWQYQADMTWEHVGAANARRPVVTPIEVSLEDWERQYLQCIPQRAVLTPDDMTTAERITQWACGATLRIAEEDLRLLNSAQLDYLYDYYQDTLVPCLAVHEVMPRVITREEATDVAVYGGYPWNPYLSVMHRAEGLKDVCPPFPSASLSERYPIY